jgi:WD40 repeat protein
MLEGHSESISSVCFSLDGKKIISGSEDKSIILWNIET